jgi:hypothetical protein
MPSFGKYLDDDLVGPWWQRRPKPTIAASRTADDRDSRSLPGSEVREIASTGDPFAVEGNYLQGPRTHYKGCERLPSVHREAAWAVLAHDDGSREGPT